MTRVMLGVFILLTGVLPVRADVLITPVKGNIVLSAGEVSCPSQPSGCWMCINDEDTTGDNRLIIALGEDYPFVPTLGYAAGVVRPFVEIDGVRITPDILPCGAYFRSGVYWLDRFTPPSCDGVPPGVTYQIGTMPAVTVTGDGETDFDIPATDAIEVPFEISLCSQFFYWGTGCNVGGSAAHSWKLYVPAAMNAVAVPAGDAAPAAMPASDFAINFSNSTGGAVAVSHVLADPPVGPTIEHLNGYWDVHTDLAPGTFTADVSFGYDPPSLPPDVDPVTIAVAIYNDVTDAWEILATTVDETAQTATATTDRLHKFVLLGGMVLPAENATWGSIKAQYGSESEE